MRTILLIGALCALTTSVFGQSDGSISGRVKDTNGGVVVGAMVTVANPSQGVSQNTQTNDTGGFTFPQLPSGTYTITAESPGFKKSEKSEVVLPTASRVNVGDLVLQVGNVTETITVEAEAGQ